MSSPLKQGTLAFTRTGQLSLSRRTASPSSSRSSSPQPTPHSRRGDRQPKPIRHNFVNEKERRSRPRDGPRSDNEDVTSDDGEDEPRLELSSPRGGARGFLLDDEAEESEGSYYSEEDEQVGPRRVGRGRKRDRRTGRYDERDEGDEMEDSDVVVEEEELEEPKKKKGKGKAIVVDSSDDGEQEEPVASTSKPKPSSSKPAAAPSASVSPTKKPSLSRTNRSTSIFEGVIIDVPSPVKKKKAAAKVTKKAAAAAGSTSALTTPDPSKTNGGLFNVPEEPSTEDKPLPHLSAGADKEEDEDADSDAVVVSPRKKPTAAGEAKGTGKGKKRARSPSSASASSASAEDSEDALPVPSSLLAQNRSLASKRSSAAGPKKKRRATALSKKKLATLSQGVRDRRSEDERSGDEEFVVGDEEELRYDTEVEDEMEERRLAERREQRAGRGSKGEGKRGEKEKEREKGKGRREVEVVVEVPVGAKKGKKVEADKQGKGKEKEKQRLSKKAVEKEQAAILASSGEEDSEPPVASSSSRKRLNKASTKSSTKSTKSTKSSKPLKKRRRRPSDEGEDDDDEPDDLEILDEQTVFEDKYRAKAREGSMGKFAALKAAREKRAAASKKNALVVLDSEDEVVASQPNNGRGRSTSARPASPKKKAHRPKYAGASSSSSSGSGSGSSSSSSEENDGKIDDYRKTGKAARRAAAAAEKAKKQQRRRARSKSAASHSNSNSDDSSSSSEDSTDIDDFIVGEEDEEAKRVVDEFREKVRGQSQGLKFYLKTYLLFLVHLIICPEVDWLRDEEFRAANNKVTEQLEGLVQSLIGSQAWKPKFKHAFDTRPELTMDVLEKADRGDGCDACTMGKKRHSVFSATVTGRKYNRKTLTLVTYSDDSSDSSSSDDDDDSDDDKKEKKYPKEKSYEFKLGASCAGRAEVYHEFTHWAYHTKERMLDVMKKERQPIPKIKITAGMSREEKKSKREEVVKRKADEAQRLGKVLDDKGVISNFAAKLDKEIKDAVNNFTK